MVLSKSPLSSERQQTWGWMIGYISKLILSSLFSGLFCKAPRGDFICCEMISHVCRWANKAHLLWALCWWYSAWTNTAPLTALTTYTSIAAIIAASDMGTRTTTRYEGGWGCFFWRETSIVFANRGRVGQRMVSRNIRVGQRCNLGGTRSISTSSGIADVYLVPLRRQWGRI